MVEHALLQPERIFTFYQDFIATRLRILTL